MIPNKVYKYMQEANKLGVFDCPFGPQRNNLQNCKYGGHDGKLLQWSKMSKAEQQEWWDAAK